MPPETVDLLFKLLLSGLVLVIVPIYAVKYGPSNFLWFSDISLFGTLLALWLENGLVASMMAVGTLLPELLWLFSFVAGLLKSGSTTSLTGYMFESHRPLYLRALSLFHLFLPPALLWLLYRYGYDERALPAQIVLAWIVLPASLLLAPADKNINWVRGFGHPPRRALPLPLHFAMMMAGFPLLIFLPTHFLLRWAFP